MYLINLHKSVKINVKNYAMEPDKAWCPKWMKGKYRELQKREGMNINS